MAAFSSRGPVFDGRIKPEVVAPGTWVLSGYADLFQEEYDPAPNPQNLLWQYDGWGYPRNATCKYMGGTSMSSPLVAGGAAVVRDFYAQTTGIGASAALVKATIINAAVDLLDENNDGIDDNAYPIPNNHEGWGRVDLAAATDGSHQFAEQTTGLTTGSTAAFAYTAVGAGSPFKATLVWTDYPSATMVATTLVNDLDLLLRAPDGTEYRGNVFSGGWSQAGGVADRTNNVENVYVTAPQPGIWTVEVTAFNIPQGPQPFALVVDGASLDGVPPTIANPPPGATLPGATVAFQWTPNGAAVTAWQLDVGSSPGGMEFHASGVLGDTTLSTSVTGLPTGGETVFARLSFLVDGVWDVFDAQYTAVTISPPAITSPPPGSLLPGAAVTFQWSANGTPVTEWQLDVGTTAGAADVYSSGTLPGGTLAHTATGLPSGGQPLFVRLSCTTGGATEAVDVQYTSEPGPPTITSPSPGSTLPGASVTFDWTASGTTVNGWQLHLGSTFGGADLYNSGILGAGVLSATATNLPTAGQSIFARLSFLTSSGWQFTDVQYIASTAAPPTITSPAPGTSVIDWRLDVGTTVGGADLHASGVLSPGTLSHTVGGLPTGGQPVFVRLHYTTASGPAFTDAQYTATAGPPTITTPTPGSVLTGASAPFTWTANGTTVNGWQLQIGSTFAGADFYDSGILGAAVLSITGLPTAGQ